jgi:hypothetical protein
MKRRSFLKAALGVFGLGHLATDIVREVTEVEPFDIEDEDADVTAVYEIETCNARDTFYWGEWAVDEAP